MNLYEKLFGPRRAEADEAPAPATGPIVDAMAEVSKSLNTLSLRLGYMETRVQQLDSKIKAVQETRSPREIVQNQYFKEVADLAAAMGPAFKGVMNACFTEPAETMRVNGHNSSLRETLSQATDALKGIDELKKEQVELRRTTTALSSQITTELASSLRPRLPKKSGKSN